MKEIRIEFKIPDLFGLIKEEINEISTIIIETKDGNQHVYEIEKVDHMEMYETY